MVPGHGGRVLIPTDHTTEGAQHRCAPSGVPDDGGAAPAAPPSGGRRRGRLILAGLVGGAVLFAASAFGMVRSGDDDATGTTGVASTIAVPAEVTGRGIASGATLDQMISGLQLRLESTPGDHVAWATLGLAYVQQARVTVDPTYYPRAEGALQRSLQVTSDGNYLAHAGLSALAAARHDFSTALTEAQTGLAINPYSALLYGALSDSLIQLGRYDEAFDAVQRMVDLSPDTSSLTRASYTWELRGDTAKATQLMERALDDAPTPADRAFVLVQLGELERNAGQPAAALERYNAALTAMPTDPPALAGKAKVEASLGQVDTALDDYARLVAATPEPSYLLDYGDLLASLGRDGEAAEQYRIFTVTQQLFAANGVQPDAVLALHVADHGDPQEAVALASAALADNPFLTLHDAMAWSLHRAGRDAEALAEADLALALGYRSARFHFHAGMIADSLGDDVRARAELTEALRLDPWFHPLEAQVARGTLANIAGAP